jgi:tetratricopeptide (TPR) repeat protein
MRATDPITRAKWATRGLHEHDTVDPDTQAMLLRQLYLSHYCQRQFEKAHLVALQATKLPALPDVAHQDCARAKQALGDVDGATAHLRMAARIGPASRRAFHYWTLGSMLHAMGRSAEAMAPLTKALRWATSGKPLYRAQLTLAKLAVGKRIRGGQRVLSELEKSPSGQGYGRFVLGQLALALGDTTRGRTYLTAFIKKTAEGQTAMQIALEAEMLAARRALDGMD